MQNCLAGSTDCCFRAMDGVTISVLQSGVTLASQVTNINGFYALAFSGDDTKAYDFKVSFYRPSGSGYPGALQEIQISPPKVLSVDFAKVYLPQNTPNYWLQDLRLNPGGDTTSINGDRATYWAMVTETQRAIASEGDTRHRHLYGTSQTGPDDFVMIDPSGGTGVGLDCPSSLISVDPAYSRINSAAVYMAGIYRGRVVGCNSTSFLGTAVPQKGPSFPPTPRNLGWLTTNPYTGEGVALGVGLDHMIGLLLRRWQPAVATAASISSTLPCSSWQNSTSNQNGNDCAWGTNNARALWEWIDTPAIGMNSTVDNSDITLKDVMDGLVGLKNTVGTGDGQGGEASFTPTAQSCTLLTGNEVCNTYEACTYQGSGTTTTFCASGDPNGSNIRDLATAIDALLIGGRGNLLTSMQSSACVGAADHTYPLDGGYLDN
jgi:hypothetical protein